MSYTLLKTNILVNVGFLILFSDVVIVSSNSINSTPSDCITGCWYVTYAGDLIFPMHTWHILINARTAKNEVHGTGLIFESGFQFSNMKLKYDSKTNSYSGQWTKYSCITITFSKDFNSALGQHTYLPQWDSLAIKSPMIWTRIAGKPTTRRINSSDKAIEMMLTGVPLINLRILGSLNCGLTDFIKKVAVVDCEIMGDANFTQANFKSGPDFSGTQFHGAATFIWATFYNHANFSDTKFLQAAYFS